MKKGTAINIKKIAKLVNMDPSTVSRALNGSEKVKLETRRHIEDVARQYGYIQDALAKSLIQGKTYTIGIVVPEISNSFYSHIIEAIENEISIYGYSIIITGTKFEYLKEKKALNTMLEKRVDAVVFCAPSEKLTVDIICAARNTPIILCDIIVDEPHLDSVSVNELAGIKDAVLHLIQLGHKKIGFIAEKGVTQRRAEIFREVISFYNMSNDDNQILIEDALSAECGYNGMKKLLKSGDIPSAVMCARDVIAIGAMSAIYENGMRIPDDISVVGYDDIGISSYLHEKLTTVRQPADEIGKQVGLLILKKMSDPEGIDLISKVCLIPKLVIRQSTSKINSKFE